MNMDLSHPQTLAAVIVLANGLITAVVAAAVTYLVTERKVRTDTALAIGQRAWTEYENRRAAYVEFISLIDAIFSGTPSPDKQGYLRAARKVRLVGADDVVRAINELLLGIRQGEKAEQLEDRFRECSLMMRKDLWTHATTLPAGTRLTKADFPIEGG